MSKEINDAVKRGIEKLDEMEHIWGNIGTHQLRQILEVMFSPVSLAKSSDKVCPYCGGDPRIANPTGKCSHIYYPDNVNTSMSSPEECPNHGKGFACEDCKPMKKQIYPEPKQQLYPESQDYESLYRDACGLIKEAVEPIEMNEALNDSWKEYWLSEARKHVGG